ncbi:transposase [Streptomyces sp. NPDC059454]|uniref:transposase n=1 Tax=Streptomyces sp. NPDC059454 TaxID=3346836 RepID=UPI0036C37A1E
MNGRPARSPPARRRSRSTNPRNGHPGDLSDDRWELIEPVLSTQRSRRRRDALGIGRPPVHGLRLITNTVLHPDRTAIPWRGLPHSYGLPRQKPGASGACPHGRGPLAPPVSKPTDHRPSRQGA